MNQVKKKQNNNRQQIIGYKKGQQILMFFINNYIKAIVLFMLVVAMIKEKVDKIHYQIKYNVLVDIECKNRRIIEKEKY